MAQPYYANSHVNEASLLARRQQSAPYFQQLLPSLPPLSQLLEQRNKEESQDILSGPGPGLTTQPLTQYQPVYYNDASSGSTTNGSTAPVSIVVDPSTTTSITTSSSIATSSIPTTTLPNITTTATTHSMVAPDMFAPSLMDHGFTPMLPMDIYGTDIATAAAAAAAAVAAAGGSVPVNTGLLHHPSQLMTEEELDHHRRVRHASVSSTSSDKVYSFVAIPGTNQKKRPRRRYDEVERLYHCNWPGCTKSYGTLNHLNAHVSMQKHGAKRHPSEFKEMRKEWRRQKKEREAAKRAADEMTQASMQHVYPPQLSYHLQPTTLAFNGFY
ncbi:hypothetical protein DFQ28_010251 [Apophysomyces sp. BC1034]|nr:hypothetical protein DFQ30_002830 [Apophysomyces sp. BC1015]KAG0183470.1 hypothetical protein DFQ29_004414 [Apophysomyces sp. BC1021]KAG0192075.1 hypothetical protein DFQ28_010251 [Apophysomyces sp. BC1034]